MSFVFGPLPSIATEEERERVAVEMKRITRDMSEEQKIELGVSPEFEQAPEVKKMQLRAWAYLGLIGIGVVLVGIKLAP